jgi:hypothetical protein
LSFRHCRNCCHLCQLVRPAWMTFRTFRLLWLSAVPWGSAQSVRSGHRIATLRLHRITRSV